MRTGIFAAQAEHDFKCLAFSIAPSLCASVSSSPRGRRPVVRLLKSIMTSSVSLPLVAASKPLVLALCISAIFSSAAYAQAQSGQTLAPLVVTANRSPLIATEVLSDHVVISSEEIKRSGHASLADLLQRQRGIEITRNGGPGNTTSVFIRGAENKQNIVLIDGVRVGSSTTGGANWANIPLSQVDRIEIVYGPLSSMYGSDAIGGVVQIFTKQGEGSFTPAVMVGAGSFGTRQVEAGIAGAGSAIRYALNAAHEKAGGFSATKPGAFGYNPDKDGYERNSVSGKFSAGLAKGHEIGLNFLKSELDAQYDGSASFDDHLVQDLESYSVFSKNQFMPNWTSQVRLGRSKDDSVNRSTTRSRFNTRQDYISWQNDVTIGKGNLLQLMAEQRQEQVDSTTTALNRERTTDAVAAAYQLRHDAHLASISIRNDDSSQFGSHTTGNLAYGYRITGALRASASYGTSFRAPSFNELYFPGFGFSGNRPEKGRNAEAGLYYDNGKARLSAVYYRNRITDLIVNARPCPAGTAGYTFGCAYNVNEALLTGVSIGAATTARNVTVLGSLDWQDARDETTGRSLPRRAKYHGRLATEYAIGKVQAGAELVFSDKRFDDAANRNVLPGYGVFNLYASHEFAPDWSVFGRWNNVLDKDYELARNYATAGSSLFVGVRYGIR